MPGGSVLSKVVQVRLENSGRVERVLCNSHIPALDSLAVFADKRDRALTFVLENGAEITITPTLDVKFGPTASLEAFRIKSVILWRMEDEGFHSRRDNPSSYRWASAEDSSEKLFEVLKDFSEAPIRCRLSLELVGGPEIGIYPSLKPDVPALYEPGFVVGAENAPAWDLYIELWPMLEEWLGSGWA